MNSFIKYIPASLEDNRAFMEHLLSIIDTKLQFAKHGINALISSYSTTSQIDNNSSGFLDNFSWDLENTPLESEKVFTLIEKYSKTTNLLLLLRSRLTEKNVSLIYDLLSNDKYLNFESNDLDIILEKSYC